MLYAPSWITFEFSYGFWTEKKWNKHQQFLDRKQEKNFDKISSSKLWFAATSTFQSVSRPNTPVWAETRKQSLALSGVTALYFSALLPLIPQGGFRGNGRDGKAGCSTQNTEKCRPGLETLLYREQSLNGFTITALIATYIHRRHLCEGQWRKWFP